MGASVEASWPESGVASGPASWRVPLEEPLDEEDPEDEELLELEPDEDDEEPLEDELDEEEEDVAASSQVPLLEPLDEEAVPLEEPEPEELEEGALSVPASSVASSTGGKIDDEATHAARNADEAMRETIVLVFMWVPLLSCVWLTWRPSR